MSQQFITLRVLTDYNLSDSTLWEEFERLILGAPSSIRSEHILEVEVVEHKSKEGWLTTA